MNEKGHVSTRDNTMPITLELFNEGFWISVAVGAYYTFNAFTPSLVYYFFRQQEISAMTENQIYKTAW